MTDAKSQKYDRQLRLWQEHGQAALESARVCLLTCTAAGTETLKNLVLPGIKSFTIVDSEIVSEADIGCNFFLDASNLGRLRAECASELLQELNEDVEGFHLSQPIDVILDEKPGFFNEFSLVIASSLVHSQLLRVESILAKIGVPLLVCKSQGFLGYVRLSLSEHVVVESHPENQLDLRLDCPWAELRQHSASYNYASMDSTDRAHVPYVVVLVSALDLWRKQRQGNDDIVPTTPDEKREFKLIIQQLAGPDGELSENFEEALSKAFRVSSTTSLPTKIRDLFSRTECETTDAKSNKIWIALKAIRLFYESEGRLPLMGTLPDMKADTEKYVLLQKVYRDKAIRDQETIASNIHKLSEHMDNVHFSNKDIQLICKNSANISILNYRSIEKELESPNVDELQSLLRQGDNFGPRWYITLTAYELFREQHKRHPGQDVADVEANVGKLKKLAISHFGSHIVTSEIEECIYECCRASDSQLHNIASMVGGVAAQECLKILTKQYLPINNTVIIDGIKSSCLVLDA
eukprot:Partr_v1_DN28087_c1_g1_i1_m57479 putative NEDD8 activating enzyme E1 subunit 1